MRERVVLCRRCLGMVRPLVSHTLPLTRTHTMRVLAISDYRDPIRPLILAKRWSDILAARHLGSLVWDLTNFRTMPADYIIPVPLHWTRTLRRGFNQAHEMANVLARNRRASVVGILRRIKRTQFQSDLSAEEREHNVHEAFQLVACERQVYRTKNLVLVDDVLTTGATLQAAARELLKLKPSSITAVVACRVV